MSEIAKTLNRPYCNSDIELYPKNNVIFEDGITIPTDQAQAKKYIEISQNQLKAYSRCLLKRI